MAAQSKPPQPGILSTTGWTSNRLGSALTQADLMKSFNTIYSTRSPSFTLNDTYTPKADSMPRPRLTEPLMKPLHRFDAAELAGLITEMKHDRWHERERAIAEIVMTLVRDWRGRHSQYLSPGSDRYTFSLTQGLLSQHAPATVAGTLYHLHIPAELPPEYAEAIIERMVRDAIEEG